MANAATKRPGSPPSEKRERYAFTVADYHQLIASGHFKRNDRIELINGELTIMPPIGPEHSFHTTRLTNTLPLKLPSGVLLRMNEPITLGNHSEPQPDAAMVRARPDGYRSAHPGPEDVLLVIEVADTSAAFDIQVKAKLYGKVGIPEYWVIDLQEGCLRVFTEPSARGFKHLQVLERGDTVQSNSIASLTLMVKELMP